jgi:hypothetical protein
MRRGVNGDDENQWDGLIDYGCGTWLFVALLVAAVMAWLCCAGMLARQG